MPQSQVTFWLNTDVKEQFESVCAQIGFDSISVLNGFITRVSRDKCLPFEFADSFSSDDALFYSEADIAELTRRAEDLRAGKGVVHELIEV